MPSALLNPRVGHEYQPEPPKDGSGRLVIVVGAGPAGLMAAETLAKRGFAVRVLEKADRPGGQVITASSCIKKDKLYWSVADLLANVESLGIKVEFGVEATADMIAEAKPYAVIVATGADALTHAVESYVSAYYRTDFTIRCAEEAVV